MVQPQADHGVHCQLMDMWKMDLFITIAQKLR